MRRAAGGSCSDRIARRCAQAQENHATARTQTHADLHAGVAMDIEPPVDDPRTDCTATVTPPASSGASDGHELFRSSAARLPLHLAYRRAGLLVDVPAEPLPGEIDRNG